MKQGASNAAVGQCALCGNPFGDRDDSREHIIPNAIGGRMKIAGFLCRDCNSRTGREWDSELGRQLNPLSNMLGIKRERGSPPAMVVDTLDGRQLRHESDGRMRMHHTEITEEEIDGKIHLHISAPSEKELRKHLRGLARRYPQLRGVDLRSHAGASKEYAPGPIGINLRFGGLAAGRSVVKSCAALAHMAGVRLDELEQAREYLHGSQAPCFGYYNELDVVVDRPARTFFHCVHVHGNERTGQVVGYVEYYAYMRIVVLLSDAYRGPGFTETHAVDPVEGTDLEVSVNLPDFTLQDIQDIYDGKKLDSEVYRKALEPLVERYVETSRKREIYRIADEAINHAGENCGIKLGERIPEEQQARFMDLLMERLTEQLPAFLLHQTETLDSEKTDQMLQADKD